MKDAKLSFSVQVGLHGTWVTPHSRKHLSPLPVLAFLDHSFSVSFAGFQWCVPGDLFWSHPSHPTPPWYTLHRDAEQHRAIAPGFYSCLLDIFNCPTGEPKFNMSQMEFIYLLT